MLLTLTRRLLFAFLEEYLLVVLGIISCKCLGDILFNILWTTRNFLYQRLYSNDSKPSSEQIFSLDVSLMTSVMVKAALYWMDSIFFRKDPKRPLS